MIEIVLGFQQHGKGALTGKCGIKAACLIFQFNLDSFHHPEKFLKQEFNSQSTSINPKARRIMKKSRTTKKKNWGFTVVVCHLSLESSPDEILPAMLHIDVSKRWLHPVLPDIQKPEWRRKLCGCRDGKMQGAKLGSNMEMQDMLYDIMIYMYLGCTPRKIVFPFFFKVRLVLHTQNITTPESTYLQCQSEIIRTLTKPRPRGNFWLTGGNHETSAISTSMKLTWEPLQDDHMLWYVMSQVIVRCSLLLSHLEDEVDF